MDSIEKEIMTFKQQLQAYDTSRENDLKLQRINDTAGRIEADIRAMKTGMEEMNTRMLTKEGESKQRDSDTTSAQDRLQIKVLVGILLLIVSVVSSLLVFYITHR